MAIVGPIALYNNLPIAPQNYQPSKFIISAVSLGITTTVTTSVNHNYVIGQLVRLLIPAAFGCIQLNEMTGYLISIPALNQMVLGIDSSHNVDSFVASSASTPAQIVAVGDISYGQTNIGRTNNLTSIPGSFINISP